MSGKKRVAIIGAGPSGLTAIKACKEEGFEPVCFERNADPGGLWRFHDEDIEGVASVMRTTIINTSKELSAFSDFPPPTEYPNFMHNSMMFNYFMLYAEQFDLLKHIRYHLEIVKVEPAKDFESTGRWIVAIKSTQTEAVTKEEFDAVMVCIGHHVYPKIPKFPGQEKFKGSITHTHSLKSCDRYLGQNVVVVGIGNSGVDAAVDCTYVAKQVYLSTRRGSWIFGRVGKAGKPYDMDFNTRSKLFFSRFRSFNSVCNDLENEVNKKFDHELYGLKPKHRILSAHPTMNDALPNCILSGRVIVKGDIKRFEENGIVFVGDDKVTEIDAVILATGYEVKFPFLDSKLMCTDENKVHLYKYAIPPQLSHPTLAIIGLFQPLGAIFPLSEMQCRWFAQILAGNLRLPSLKEMEKDIRCKNEMNDKRYVASTRHTIQVDWIPFMDEISSQIGAKPNLLKLAFTDPKLFLRCLNGPCLPYQFRLQGPHSWPEAREVILNFEERVYAPLNSEAKKICAKNESSISSKKLFFALLISTAGFFYARKYLDNVPINMPNFKLDLRVS
ncbi:flavin-containing monooxygenase 5-like [Uloborus diversus]|uniref:flavin-containing monooxygenase 5-like n=1 Tax=Uloborus diversus TaxID=327109 RepID=UPI0024096642|nr:flavin-containing monooxygenase 5-like [Uloborus diversus]XP_054708710.1 flavin-containing monooxygenase 5-like [Uloborus diversus]